jgi:hypothetical protein
VARRITSSSSCVIRKGQQANAVNSQRCLDPVFIESCPRLWALFELASPVVARLGCEKPASVPYSRTQICTCVLFASDVALMSSSTAWLALRAAYALL